MSDQLIFESANGKAVIENGHMMIHDKAAHLRELAYDMATALAACREENGRLKSDVRRMDANHAELHAENERLRAEQSQQFHELMDAVTRSRREHGDCKSGKRYGGKPRACSACMAELKLKEMIEAYKGRTVRLA